jgi:ribosomal protein S12 methylthiotransferase accessory factor
MEILNKGYINGTHRLISPEQTLANISHHLPAMGITRCANVTGLDRIGIPVYCSIKPRGRMVQIHNGKGLFPIAAKVSALMEAIEVFHYENPGKELKRSSLKRIQKNGETVIHPHSLPLCFSDNYFSPDFIIDWVKGENLLTKEEVWIPASAAYICSPSLYSDSSNGLASGNHIIEATLHGIYELIERDAIARLSVNGRLSLQGCQIIDLSTSDDLIISELIDRIQSANLKLVLIWAESCIPIHTFWAVLLDKNPINPAIVVNMGYGTHLSFSVAATRAITEAVQSRLTFIYGASEELAEELSGDRINTYQKIYQYFDRLEATTPWQTFNCFAGSSLSEDYHYVLRQLSHAGFQNLFRVDLTRSPFNIPVVKVFLRGLAYNPSLTG